MSTVRSQEQLFVGTWNTDSNMLYICFILYIFPAASIGVSCSNFGCTCSSIGASYLYLRIIMNSSEQYKLFVVIRIIMQCKLKLL
jgi:hypothetical protein